VTAKEWKTKTQQIMLDEGSVRLGNEGLKSVKGVDIYIDSPGGRVPGG